MFSFFFYLLIESSWTQNMCIPYPSSSTVFFLCKKSHFRHMTPQFKAVISCCQRGTCLVLNKWKSTAYSTKKIQSAFSVCKDHVMTSHAAVSGVTITELEYCCLGVIYEVLGWWCQLPQTTPGHATCNIPSVGVTMYIYIIALKEWGEIWKGFLCNKEGTSFENHYLKGFNRMWSQSMRSWLVVYSGVQKGSKPVSRNEF